MCHLILAVLCEERCRGTAVVIARDYLEDVGIFMARQKKGLDVVETVLALAQDVESEVDFDVGLECHLQSVLHLAIALTAASTVAVTCSRHGRPVSSYSGKTASTGATKEIICRILASSSGMPLVRM